MPKKILITAGPTREMFDPVRYLSNLSTGEMGYSLARVANRRGYQTTLVSGPVLLTPPKGIRQISIVSARDLQRECSRLFPQHDILVMTAAVCDFRPRRFRQNKIRRASIRKFELEQNPDIVAGLAKRKKKRLVIGFCLETSDWINRAKKKLRRKNLDGIVANYLSSKHVPFGNRSVHTAFISRDGNTKKMPILSKRHLAQKLIEWIEAMC